MNKQYFNVTKINNDIGEIDIYGEIVDTALFDDDTSATSFKDALKELKQVKNINVNLNSGGGDVFTGVAIHNMLKTHKAHVTIKIDGLAASIASVIAMAGDKVVMPRNAMMMIHNAWTMGVGDARDLRKQADDLDKINNVVIESYTDKNPELDVDELKDMMNDETWLSAQEAYELGLIDEIAEANKAAANITKNQIERYDNVPRKFRNEGEPKPPEEITVEDVMATLEEIKSDVKAIREKMEKDNEKPSNPGKEEEPPNNSFAKLFNLS